MRRRIGGLSQFRAGRTGPFTSATLPLRFLRPFRFSCALRPGPVLAALLLPLFVSVRGAATETPAGPPADAGTLFIQEYRVEGIHLLANSEVEEAVYPFLGPGRTTDDVEKARTALEKIYRDKGFQTVSVQVPPQEPADGVVVLQVTEAAVGRLRVTGSRYFSPAVTKAAAPSLAEGRVPNFNEVQRDIIALNQNPDRRVTPALLPGATPGTVDVNLDVKDSAPVHANVELNNRHSAGTTQLRLNAGARATNLWQLGHTAGLSLQVAPERPEEARIFSGYYLARLPEADGVSLMLQGTKQDSNVSTLGGAAVAGHGSILGARVLVALPAGKNFYQSAGLGFDYKHFDQDIVVAGVHTLAPVTYWPFSASYDAGWSGTKTETALSLAVTFHLRGFGSGSTAFNNSRFGASGSFFYLRGELAQTRELPGGFQIFGKAQGQLASQPLLSAEQFSAGGLGTARGYLEGETAGDNAIFGSAELRTPPLASRAGLHDADWRVYVFAEGGWQTLIRPLPGQTAHFGLASVGLGTRLRAADHFNLSLDAGFPLLDVSPTRAGDWALTFRVWAEY